MNNKEGKIEFTNWQKLYHSFMGFLLSKGYYVKFAGELELKLSIGVASFTKKVVESNLCLVEDMIIAATITNFSGKITDFWNEVNYEWIEFCKSFNRTKPKQKSFNSIW